MSRKDESNNRANQRNPNNEAYWTSRGYDERPDDWQLSRAAAKHTTVAKRKCTTGVMGDGSDLGVSGGTGTVGRGPWEDYGPACSGADDAEAFSRLPLRR